MKDKAGEAEKPTQKLVKDIMEEFDRANAFNDQKTKRQYLLEEIQKALTRASGNADLQIVSYISRCDKYDSGIIEDDFTLMRDVLRTSGKPKTLYLILNSPGGDPHAAGRLIKLFNSHCKKDLIVVVPNLAKSAATMIALSANRIMMGPEAELGLVDPQIPISVEGYERRISAQHFIDARHDLMKAFDSRVARKQDVRAVLAQLQRLSLPFIISCESLIEYTKFTIIDNLTKYMFKKRRNKRREGEKVAKALTSPLSDQRMPPHYKDITFKEAQKLLGRGNILEFTERKPQWWRVWELIYQYYLRVDTLLKQWPTPDGGMFIKIIESSTQTIAIAVRRA